ncbi:nucleotidyltransferase family protein [Lentiprolixibacter aurantiacus]|uniref:Nucleotidyltransferase family protein n=1 Tax=Lentiprolixibacter aurantiacus TaxID=2993939 RepID=A0AAE3MKX9_9FLAO|nr:nucleotidyltransferase family protein [Lentiprolixibacter aurantiacus]MCX2719606.1 nucleotidyltransferase family protein [Lentiprolixibacter aurantiacus]
MSPSIQILILAAGRGSRMGSTKQLLPYLDRTLLGSVVERANSLSLGKPMVILGNKADKIKKYLAEEQADLVVNSSWERGMGNTLSYGVKKAAATKPELQAVLIMLGDQPKISKTHLLQLIQEYKNKKSPIIATAYAHGGGVPAIFDKAVFPDLIDLDGDRGAHKIIRNYPATRLLVPDKKEVWDIDSPEDYQRLLDGE